MNLLLFLEFETSEHVFHAWLQEHINLVQVQLLYRSPLYNAFLTRLFTQQFIWAKNLSGNRGETIRVLLESAKFGSVDHAAVVFHVGGLQE